MKKSLICAGAATLLMLSGCGSNAPEDDNTFTVGMECGYAPFN